MNQATRITVSALALGIAGVLAAGQAHATGFQLRESSTKVVGRSFSGMASATDDASVVINNPAMMSTFDQTTVQADVTIIDLNADFAGGGTTAFGTPLTGGDGGDPGDPSAVPNLAAIFPMQGALEGLTLGAAIGAPFGLKTEYDRDWVGRYNAVESDVEIIDLTLSASLKLHDRFSVGLGLVYERADVTLSNALDLGTIMASTGIPGAAPQGADGFVSVSGDDTSFGWLAGVQWQPTDQLRIGYSHRSEIDHDLEGDVTFTTPASFQAAQEAYRLAATNPALPAGQRAQLLGLGNGFGAPGFDNGITAPLTTPSVDILSATYAFTDNFRMMADVQWTDWSSLRNVSIDFDSPFQATSVEPFDWNDTELYSLGAEWDINDRFTLRGGIAKDETPTHIETRTPRLPDNDRMLYSIGLTWKVSEAFSVDAAYQRIQIDDAGIQATSSTGATLAGEFEANANLLGVAAQYRF